MFRLLPALALVAVPTFAFAFTIPAKANDSAGGLDATGLFFIQTDQVVMQSEDLFIGLDRIAVEYVFANISDRDFATEVIFPMPPLDLEEMSNSDFNLPEDPGRENLLNFTVTVDGQPVPVAQERIAVKAPSWAPDRPLAEQYDTPGTDVTAELRRAGIADLSTDPDAVAQALLALPPKARDQLEKAGLATYGSDGFVTPLWSVILRYHWTQDFPAGKSVRISHGYDNRPALGNFSWQHGETGEYHDQIESRYCVDGGTSRAMEKALVTPQLDGTSGNFGYAATTNYVLRTANSWSGPIGSFRLTLDKGQADNVISLCFDGVKKTGPTIFTVEKMDFTPDRDLEILVIIPTANITKNRN